jgi:hypothetical protein
LSPLEPDLRQRHGTPPVVRQVVRVDAVDVDADALPQRERLCRRWLAQRAPACGPRST